MERYFSLLPLWIIGAPLVLAIINRFTTPKADAETNVYRSTGTAARNSPYPAR